MEDFQKLAASGGNDLYTAGTYKLYTVKTATVTFSSALSSGTATVTANGLAKVATYASSLAVTAGNFILTNKDAYAAIGLGLSYATNGVMFTALKPNLSITLGISNLTTDLTGSVGHSTSGPSDVATFTLSATGTPMGLVTVNGLSKNFTWDTNVGTTTLAFVAAHAAAYAAIGIVLTGTVTCIFTANPGVTITDASFIKLDAGDAAATIVRTKTKLPYPVYALNVFAEAVLTSYKYLNDNGVITEGYNKFLGATLTVGSPVLVFRYPVVELVVASGTLTFNFVK
jgi:hypothetical protein